MFNGLKNWFKGFNKKQEAGTCRRCNKIYIRNVFPKELSWWQYCKECFELCLKQDALKFVYSGSDHWHSESKLYLINCGFKQNKISYGLFWRLSNDVGWSYLESFDNYIDAVLFANKNFLYLEDVRNNRSGSYSI